MVQLSWRHLLCAIILVLPAVAIGQQPPASPASEPTPQPTATPESSPDPAATPDPNAGEPTPQPAATPEPAVPSPAQSIEELKTQLDLAQTATDLSEDVKARVVGFYTQAIQQLELARQWAAKAAEFDAERQSAPEKLAALKTELEAPLSDATLDGDPPDATRAEHEQLLRQAQSDLEAEKRALADWERERERRTARRKEIPELLAGARTRLQALSDTPQIVEPDQPAVVRLAQQAARQTRPLAIEREIETYNAELASYDARRDLMQARLDRASRRIAYLDKLVALRQTRVQEKASEESEKALSDAQKALEVAAPAYRQLAKDRAEWAIDAKKLQAENKSYDERLSEADSQLSRVIQDFESVTRRVSATGLTNAIGQILREKRNQLPNTRTIELNQRKWRERIGDAELQKMELQDKRGELLREDAKVAEILEEVDAPTDDDRQKAREAVAAARADIDNLIKEYDRLFDKLVDLDAKEQELLRNIQRFQAYIEEKILWIKSHHLPSSADIQYGRENVEWLLDPTNWSEVVTSIRGTINASPAPFGAGVLGILALWLASPWLLRIIRQAGEIVATAKDNMGRTVGVLAATVGLTVRWPATLMFASWMVGAPEGATAFSKAVALGLEFSATVLLTLRSFRHLAHRGGLAEKHFRWNARSLTLLKRNLVWLTAILVPAFFIFATVEMHAYMSQSARSAIGRLVYIIALLAIILFVYRVLRPAGPVLAPVLLRRWNSWLYRMRHVWYLIVLNVPVALIVASIVGYYYTSLYFTMQVIDSILLVLCLTVAKAMVERWLMLQIRRRAIAEARERAALRQQQQQQHQQQQQEKQQRKSDAATPPSSQEMFPAAEEEKLDYPAINKQTLQLVHVALMVVGVFALWGIWADALPALRVFHEVEVWSVTEGEVEASEDDGKVTDLFKIDNGERVRGSSKSITLANLGLAALVTIITVVAVKNIPGLLEITILNRLPIDAGGRFAASTIVRYLLTVIGTVIAFGQIGVGWSQVQWLVAAMTVGLGFGLQEIFANLVSGLMLLFERPIRIGDTVTVGDISGTVSRIRTRATTVVGWDRKELIIPNKEFITGKVVNWTLSDSTLRLIIPVGIAYGSDTKLAREVMLRVISEDPNVLPDPAPHVVFNGFGDSTLNFEARVFIGSLNHYIPVLDSVHDGIDQAFRAAGIEIAFPQRDLHIRSIQGALPISRTKEQMPPPGVVDVPDVPEVPEVPEVPDDRGDSEKP
jgi:potassium efflux system protein